MNHNHANGETLPYREVNPVPSHRKMEGVTTIEIEVETKSQRVE